MPKIWERVSDAQIRRAYEASGGNIAEAARQLGINERNVRRRCGVLGLTGTGRAAAWKPEEAMQVAAVPDIDDIDELLEHRRRSFKRKSAHEEASRLIPVKVKVDGPIGILHFGDPHVDDDGTDIEALEAHTDLCNRTPGLFAANIGDTSNNWTGRLARLYAEQSTTAKQAWMLAEWFVKRCQWLYMIGGNHDCWSGAGDPLQWIARGQTYLHRPSEARLSLHFPNQRTVQINARHDHSGHSQWNPAHGAMKALQLGLRDHIAVAGHKHTSGYGVIKDPETGRVCHALQIGSYKVYDRYAKERGFRDQQFSPCALTVIDPALPETDPDMIKVFWNAAAGAEYLTWKRRK
jgi:hypothetical protein